MNLISRRATKAFTFRPLRDSKWLDPAPVNKYHRAGLIEHAKDGDINVHRLRQTS